MQSRENLHLEKALVDNFHFFQLRDTGAVITGIFFLIVHNIQIDLLGRVLIALPIQPLELGVG